MSIDFTNFIFYFVASPLMIYFSIVIYTSVRLSVRITPLFFIVFFSFCYDDQLDVPSKDIFIYNYYWNAFYNSTCMLLFSSYTNL